MASQPLEAIDFTNNADCAKDNSKMISLESLAVLTGFPIETIKAELLPNHNENQNLFSMDELRSIMEAYINKTFSPELAEL